MLMQNLRGQTKSVMIFTEMAYGLFIAESGLISYAKTDSVDKHELNLRKEQLQQGNLEKSVHRRLK